MKACTITLLLSLFALSGYSQTLEELERLFHQKKFAEVTAQSKILMAKEPNNAYPYGMIGSILVWESKYDSALPFVLKSLQLDNDSTWVSGWGHVNLGTVYLYTGQRQKGITELVRGIELNGNGRSVKRARHLLDSIGYDVPEKKYPKDYLPNWVKMEGKDITYKFQDTVGLTNAVYKFMLDHERAYALLNPIFEPKPPTRIVVHVWNDGKIARRVLDYNRKLCFTFPKLSFCHEDLRHNHPAHEITHALVHWSWGTENQTISKLVSEGLAIYYDRLFFPDAESGNSQTVAKELIARYKIKGVLRIWENEWKYDDDVLYPVAGAFIKYLHDNSTPEEFKALVKRQILDEAKVIYGAKLYELMKNFDALMGMKGAK